MSARLLKRSLSSLRFSRCIQNPRPKTISTVNSFLCVTERRSAFTKPSFQQTCCISTALPLRGEMVQFHLSDIGEGIKEVTVKEWFVKVGDTVAQFDQICEVQSDKASVTITSRFDGVISKLHYDVDDIAQTGDPLVDIEVQSAPSDNVDVQEAEAIQVGQDSSAASAIAARGDKKVLATPAVRRMASEHNLQLSMVEGSGKDGRVLKEDIINYLENAQQPQAKTPTPATPPKVSPSAPPKPTPTPIKRPTSSSVVADKEIKFSGFTRAMTKTMTAALQIPHFVYCDEFEMGELMNLRKNLNVTLAESGIKLSYMPFLVKATSIALTEYPIINSSIDLGNEKIILKGSHNLGVAMDTRKQTFIS